MVTPLVSIGVPTVGRAHLLAAALDSLVSQTYPNIEILVSDNCSDDGTPAVCKEYSSRFPIVRYHRLTDRVPVMMNFRSALLLTSGKYFMWASDDDRWESNFVASMVTELEKDPALALVAAEAQYCLSDGTLLDFFPEGEFWYRPHAYSAVARMRAILRHNYGNLIYGMYRRDALIASGGTVLDSMRFINEIPLFLRVAAAGEIRVCPEVMFYKTTNMETYKAALREYGLHSGELSTTKPMGSPWALRRRLRTARDLGAYHIATFLDIYHALSLTNLSFKEKSGLISVAAGTLGSHFLKLSLVWPTQNMLASRRAAR